MKQDLFRKKSISAMIHESSNSDGGLKRTLTAANLVTLGIGAIVG
ncbi:hypothetical protein AGMMS49525_17440 [Bacteroidia bacterium]|nr:hypothetical protein AGMMS49525_17440 [Bacteroidia bacterium]